MALTRLATQAYIALFNCFEDLKPYNDKYILIRVQPGSDYITRNESWVAENLPSFDVMHDYDGHLNVSNEAILTEQSDLTLRSIVNQLKLSTS